MNPRIAYLIQQSVAKEISDDEQKELSHIVNKDKELFNLYQFLIAKSTGKTEEDLLNAEQAYAAHFVTMEANRQFEPVAPSFQEVAKNSSGYWRNKVYYYVAAACLIAVVFTTLYHFSVRNTTTQPTASAGAANNIITTNKGSKSHLTLPDGTKVWLNADSRLEYAGDFTGKLREVQLIGEAFFEVTKDTSRPFLIHTPAINIRVLGTAFNVRAYPGERNTETTLVHGLVEVTLQNQPEKKMTLWPNEKLMVANNADSILKAVPVVNDNKSRTESSSIFNLTKIKYINQDSLSAETSWIENVLTFQSEPFEKVVSKIEKWYDVAIVVQNQKLYEKHFTADFRDNTLHEVLQSLMLTGKFRYELKNGKIIIY